jgi:spore coat protein CotH
MQRTQFGGASGNLYKPDGPGADWSHFDAPSFEKKTNKSKPDYTDIQAAIAALHADAAPAVWRTNLEKVFDVDGFLRWLAVNQVVDNWDSYGRLAHNYYLYADPGHGGRLSWIPWDNNYTFGLSPFGFGNLAGISIRGRQGGGVPLFSSNQDVLYEDLGPGWPLISKLLDDETYRARYRHHLREALGGLYAREAVTARVRAWQALIGPIVGNDKPVRSFVPAPASHADTIDGPGGLLEQIERRRVLIEAALAR